MEDEARYTIRMPEELYSRLRVMAGLKQTSINKLICSILDEGAAQQVIETLYRKRAK